MNISNKGCYARWWQLKNVWLKNESVWFMEALYDLYCFFHIFGYSTKMIYWYSKEVKIITNTLQLSWPKYVDMDAISLFILSVQSLSWGNGVNLGRVGGGVTIIRIYGMKNQFLILKKPLLLGVMRKPYSSSN